MEILIFTLNAIVVYLVSDWLVRFIEGRRGAPVKQRQVLFFLIFLILAMVSFQLLNMLFAD